MEITLNQGQQLAVDSIVQGGTMARTQLQGYTLQGEGGTGKTTCIMWAIKEFLKAGLRVLVTAPTNKAVKQLEKSAREAGVVHMNVEFMTVAKALGLTLLPTAEQKRTRQVKDPVVSDYDIFIMDEGSMVSAFAFNQYLLPELEHHKIFTVVMGDEMQLPPVRETESVALQFFPQLTLTQTERFAEGTGIANVTTALRQAIQTDRPFVFKAEEHPDLKVVKPVFFLKEVVSHFDTNTDLEKVRALAYTNARVNTINNAIREKIYGKGAAKFVVGERVVTGRPIYRDDELLLTTDEEAIIQEMVETTIQDEETGQEYKAWGIVLNPCYAETGLVYTFVVHPDDAMILEEDLAALARQAKKSDNPNESRALWAKYHQLAEISADIRHCYAITVHRSQGSTYDTVLVDSDNILGNKRRNEKRALLYVALSRARHNLISSRERYVA